MRTDDRLIHDQLLTVMARSLTEAEESSREVAFNAMEDYLAEKDDERVVLTRTDESNPQQWFRIRLRNALSADEKRQCDMSDGWSALQMMDHKASRHLENSLGGHFCGCIDHPCRSRMAGVDCYITEPYDWDASRVAIAVQMAIFIQCGLFISKRSAYGFGTWRAAFLNIDAPNGLCLYRIERGGNQ